MDLSVEREVTKVKWQDISQNYSVPKSLFDHQTDTITLLLHGEHVFCGSPTGSGKTLAQLCTVLFTSGTALVIPPLQTIENQMVEICTAWGISHINLSSISEDTIGENISKENPNIIISSIEKISNPVIQRQLLNLKLEYIAIDEAQVLDPNTGWTKIRPYCSETWAYLRARFKCPFLFLSATMEEDSLIRISANLDLPREKINVLYKNPDRANIYQQRRVLTQSIDIRSLQKELSFILPAIVDSRFKKCQIFCTSRYTTDIVAAWLKEELKKLAIHVNFSVLVEKLTGDNTRTEKERVMKVFKDGTCRVLVCTDVAGMGIDVKDLNFSVNIGIPKNAWKMKQQSGRIGRSGENSLDITLVFPQKGSAAPEPSLRKAIRESKCIRLALNNLFVISNPLVDYSTELMALDCEDAGCELLYVCQCSLCKCCTGCTAKCLCAKAAQNPNIVMENILGLGDDKYRTVQELLTKEASSSEDEDSNSDIDDWIEETLIG